MFLGLLAPLVEQSDGTFPDQRSYLKDYLCSLYVIYESSELFFPKIDFRHRFLLKKVPHS